MAIAVHAASLTPLHTDIIVPRLGTPNSPDVIVLEGCWSHLTASVLPSIRWRFMLALRLHKIAHTCTGSLPSLPTLKHLDLRNNSISSLQDLSRLAGMTSLESLHLANRDGSEGNPGEGTPAPPPDTPHHTAPTPYTVTSQAGYREAVADALPFLDVMDGRHTALTAAIGMDAPGASEGPVKLAPEDLLALGVPHAPTRWLDPEAVQAATEALSSLQASSGAWGESTQEAAAAIAAAYEAAQDAAVALAQAGKSKP